MNWLKKIFDSSKSAEKRRPIKSSASRPNSDEIQPSPTHVLPTQPAVITSVLPGLEAMLRQLGNQAWLPSRSRNLGTTGFIFTPPLLLPRDSRSVDAAIKTLYEHARLWAAGFEIPYHVPPIRVQSNIRAAGEFKVDIDGWITIHISSRYLDHPNAVWLILAHEVCHHILNLSGFDDKRDAKRNEQMTDLAMFVFGFGDLVKAGFKVISRDGDEYTKTHLGYLQAKEYSYAYRWVIVARQRNELSGVKGIKVSDPTLALDFGVKPAIESVQKEFRHRIPDDKSRERHIERQRQRFPHGSMEEWLTRALAEYNRDNR